jgi:anthranilate phosphoribosyltransferase
MADGRSLLQRLIDRENLEGSEVESFIGSVMDGQLEGPEVAAVLVALRMKGETGEELAAAARAMRVRSVSVPVIDVERAVDTCGTGGDGVGTINISTAAALVVSAAGVPVAKHGNRSVSSRCGSADVLEKCGVRLDVEAEDMARLVDDIGVAFLFAPRLHPTMGAVMPVRRTLGVRTVFNLLGPLTNPAGVRRQVVGVWGSDVQPLVAEALAELGTEHGLVVHSDDGLDELSVCAPSTAIEVRNGEVVDRWRVDPADLGIEQMDGGELLGGNAAQNAERLAAILGGDERSAASEAVALNAAAGLLVAGVVNDLGDGLGRARDIVRSGAALDRLRQLAHRSQELAGDD